MRCGSDLSPHWWENATFTSTPTLFHKYVPATQGFVKVFITMHFPLSIQYLTLLCGFPKQEYKACYYQCQYCNPYQKEVIKLDWTAFNRSVTGFHSFC